MTKSALSLLLIILNGVFSAPEVPLGRGVVQGVDKNAPTTQKPYHIYYGIPFAQPPVRRLRFQPPAPFYASDPTELINSPNGYQKACIQNVQQNADGQSEDCLYLNVFTPGVASASFNPNSGRKVMVWIHGGGYLGGDSISYRPSRLVTDFDVIVVTTQYRLGPFGFLSSGDDVLPGNLGLRDQILALNWVKDNIRRFGGDPDDVTIFGESAGGNSVSLLSVSPMAKGLFTKAVMQSGTALTPGAMRSHPEELLYHVAKNTRCLPYFYTPNVLRGFFSRSSDSMKYSYHERIVNCLKRITARELHDSYADIDLSRVLIGGGKVEYDSPLDILNSRNVVTFAPSVDGQVLPRDPTSLLADRDYMAEIGALNRSYIIGFTNNEGMLFGQLLMGLGVKLDNLTENEGMFRAALTNTALSLLPSFSALPPEILNFVSLMYAYPRDWMGKPPIQGLFEIATDTGYVIPSVEMARALVSLAGQVNVYLYLFDHYPETIDSDGPFQGTGHSVDLSYLFDERLGGMDGYAKVYAQSSLPLFNIYRGVLANFANTGNPSLFGSDKWLPYDMRSESYYAISTTPELRQHVYRRRVSLWTEVLPCVVQTMFTRGPRSVPLIL